MIKINLLPAHILERQRIRSVIILAVVVLLLEVGVLGLVMTRVKQQLADAKTELAYWQQRAQAVGQFEKETQTVNGQIAFFSRWPAWRAAINQYHDNWAAMLAEMARWIYRKVQLDAMSPTPLQVQFQGRTSNLESFRRAYLNIIRCPRYANVSFSLSGVQGGWAEGQALGARAAAPRAAGSLGAGAARAGGGLQIRLGGGRRPSSARTTGGLGAGPAQVRAAPRVGGFGAGMGGLRRTTPTGAGGLAALAGVLPIGVTFDCILKPEFGMGLTPPMPPIAGVAPAGGGGRAAARPGGPPAGRGGVRIRMGGRRGAG